MKRLIFNPNEEITLERIVQKREESERQAKAIENAIRERITVLFARSQGETDMPPFGGINGSSRIFSWINGIILTTKIIRAIRSFFIKR